MSNKVKVNATGLAIRGKGHLRGYVVQASAAGTMTVDDGLTASGVELLTAKAVAAGDIVSFPGNGMPFNDGIFVTVAAGSFTLFLIYD